MDASAYRRRDMAAHSLYFVPTILVILIPAAYQIGTQRGEIRERDRWTEAGAIEWTADPATGDKTLVPAERKERD